MVDAYATRYGSVTLAVDAERFLLEESQANVVLSLHPAVTLREGARPRGFTGVRAFTASDEGLEVVWAPVGGLEARTALRRIDDRHYELELSVVNRSDQPVRPAMLHPFYFPPEGPGACGLGFERLRTVGRTADDDAICLRRVQGAEIVNPGFGLWFGESGRPMMLIASRRPSGAESAPQAAVAGARGKILSVRLDEAAPAEALTTGQVWGPARWLLAFGDLDIARELRGWADTLRAEGIRFGLPEFDPAGEPAPEAEEVETEPDLSIDEEEEEEPEIVETPVAQEEAEGAAAETAVAETAVAETAVAETAASPQHGRAGYRIAGCAELQRAWRRTRDATEDGRGFWPRWAAGRLHPPIRGTSTRTRDRWRRHF